MTDKQTKNRQRRVTNIKTKMINKKFNENLAIFAIFTIPIITFLFGTKKSPFQYTLSMIGNWFGLDYKIRFIIWGTLTAFLITYFIIYIYKKTGFKQKKAFRYLHASAIFLILTVITPTVTKEFVPMELRVYHISMHIIYSLFFAISLITSLYLFSKYLSHIDKAFSKERLRLLVTVVGLPLIILFLFGMTGIFEIFFFIAISLFLWLINKNINRKFISNWH